MDRRPPAHCSAHDTAERVLDSVGTEAPDLVVTDVRLPPDQTDEGAVGYLLKDRISDIDAFLDAVDDVASGGVVLDPHVVRQLVRRHPPSVLDRLTNREREVPGLVADGRSNRAIAEQLTLSTIAVEKHISNIFDKLDLFSEDMDKHRRVRATLLWLDHASA